MTDFEITLDADEVNALEEARRAWNSDVDDDFATAETRGYRTTKWLSLDFYLVLNWDRLIDSGLLERDALDPQYLRVTDFGFQVIEDLRS